MEIVGVNEEDNVVILQNIEDNTLLSINIHDDETLRKYGIVKTVTDMDQGQVIQKEKLQIHDTNHEKITVVEKMVTDSSERITDNGKRMKWCKDGIIQLINLRIAYDKEFKSTTIKNDMVWQKVANDLRKNGYDMTATQCNDKWRYLKAKYTAKKDNLGDRGTGEPPMEFEYFELMDSFLGQKHNIQPVAVASSIKGDTLSNTTTVEVLDEEEGPTPKKNKLQSKIIDKVKNNKAVYHKLLEDISMASKTREIQRERRHQELLAARNNAVEVFGAKMDKLIEKLSK